MLPSAALPCATSIPVFSIISRDLCNPSLHKPVTILGPTGASVLANSLCVLMPAALSFSIVARRNASGKSILNISAPVSDMPKSGESNIATASSSVSAGASRGACSVGFRAIIVAAADQFFPRSCTKRNFLDFSISKPA